MTRGELRLETAGKPRSLLRGVAVFGLPEWRELLTVDGPTRLTPAQVEQAAQLLEPTVKVALNGELRHPRRICPRRITGTKTPWHWFSLIMHKYFYLSLC